MIKLPYRNKMKHNNDLNFNPNQRYNNDINIKPFGFWYQINNCAIDWGELDWGNFCYTVELKKNILNKKHKLLSLKTVEEIKTFNKKYKVTHFRNLDINMIDWGEVAEDYGGFEIKNYKKIDQELRKEKKYIKKYGWFNSFDFSSGCIWDLTLIKNIEFFKKLTDKEKEYLRN